MPATTTPADSTATDSTATDSTATPQSIEGEPAMTTTVAALNTGRESTPDEPSATENARRAGIERRDQAELEDADTAPFEFRVVEAKVGQRLTHLVVGLAGRDDTNPGI